MRQMIRAGLLIAACVGGLSCSPQKPASQAVVIEEPNPDRARPLDRWPSAADLARLQSVEGQPQGVVLQTLGHPSRVERRPNGEEVWDYPWRAACRVWIRKGVCTGTFYTAGY